MPLLAGWNSEEERARGARPPTSRRPRTSRRRSARLYGDREGGAEEMYVRPRTRTKCCRRPPIWRATGSSPTAPGSGSTPAAETGGKPVYRYYYARPRPDDAEMECDSGWPPVGGPAGATPPPPPARRRAFGRDRVRDGQSGRQQGLRMDAGRSQGLRRPCRNTSRIS